MTRDVAADGRGAGAEGRAAPWGGGCTQQMRGTVWTREGRTAGEEVQESCKGVLLFPGKQEVSYL